jgi:hypothetical protein
MGNSNPFCGPPVYPDVDVHLPGFGLIPDQSMTTIVEAATSVYDQNNFDVTNPKNWTNAKEQVCAQQWKQLISRQNRNWYATAGRTEHDWYNELRNFLKQNSDWGQYKEKNGLHNHNPVDGWQMNLFDPIHWRLWWSENNKWHDKGGYNIVNYDGNQHWYQENMDNIFTDLRDYYGNVGGAFGWSEPDGWTKKGYDAKTDISAKDPLPPIEGFGITQFLEWLTGLNYYQLFTYEYSLVLFITLISIAWTDFFPFFVEIGLINP